MDKNLLQAALAVTALAFLAACSSGASSSVTQVPQPPSASSVAQQLGLTRFTDCGSAPAGGVTDSGTAFKDSERIGIDTFPSQDVRDTWIKTAAKFGIAPAWESGTWVAYKAVAQSAKACS